MKTRHRVPDLALTNNMTGRIEESYQAEVDRSTYRLEREYQREQKQLDAAQRRLDRVTAASQRASTERARKSFQREIRVAWELVEIRRTELNRLAGLMAQSPQSAANRGDRSYRPVPARHGGLI